MGCWGWWHGNLVSLDMPTLCRESLCSRALFSGLYIVRIPINASFLWNTPVPRLRVNHRGRRCLPGFEPLHAVFPGCGTVAGARTRVVADLVGPPRNSPEHPVAQTCEHGARGGLPLDPGPRYRPERMPVARCGCADAGVARGSVSATQRRLMRKCTDRPILAVGWNTCSGSAVGCRRGEKCQRDS